ncbi:MAG: TonB-dependent receptor [Bacteroidetes bacterium]|nr:TonB-dependent receptor [Bacteroidota bacterium]
MRQLLFITLILSSILHAQAGKVSGIVTDDKGHLLPFASILVKGTPRGTTTNNEGKYFINLNPGTYTIVCQYVGYERKEKKITVGTDPISLDFSLSLQQLTLSEVVVKPGGEDPAYEIIRNAIKKRPYYLNQVDRFRCEVYIKGQLRLRDYPKKFMGQKVDFEDGDTSKKKIVYLSETIASYTFQRPNKTKVEVVSSKVSGQSDAFGFSAPQIISFYENNIPIGRNLNPRGFISPIADKALNYYKYKFEGSFFEDGKEVDKIKVIPKRKFEPLFSGYIEITDGDWRIHSLQLMLTKESQMQFVDTLRIEQLYVPYDKDVWVIKSQVIYPSVKIFGFDAYGSFVNVYSKFDLDPSLEKKYFNNTFLKFNEGANKKPADYWDTIRPVPLQIDEVKDYHKKDSLEKARKDPHYLDSLDRIRNKITAVGLLLTGTNINKEKTRTQINLPSLLSAVSFNTVEGWTINWRASYTKRLDSGTNFSRRNISFSPVLRYGFSNRHLNAYGVLNYNYGKKFLSSLSIAGGRRVYQFNNENPIAPLYNSVSTLVWERNYMKLYEAWFGRANYSKAFGDGFRFSAGLQFQNRTQLQNTTNYSFKNWATREYTPNYPIGLDSVAMPNNSALIASAEISWQPGARYIEFPDRKIMVGSKYPRFSLQYIQGVPNIFGSNVDYSKWQFGINQNLNFKLAGTLSYNLSAGGFLNTNKLFTPDYNHFNGNQIIIASDFSNSFQLLPYYQYSNKATFYAAAHLGHHFNGLITNKIPLLRKWNWHLVAGANGFYINQNSNYFETYVGLENILRVLRVDFLWGFEQGNQSLTGFRITIPVNFAGPND